MDATLDFIEKRGEERGEKRGEKRGERRGEQRIIDLYQMLANDGRLNELNEAVKDRNKLTKLLKEYSLIDSDI